MTKVFRAWLGLNGFWIISDSVWLVALSWYAVQLADPRLSAFIVVAGNIPRGLLVLFGGVLSDAVEARWVVAICASIRAAAMAGLVAATLLGSLNVWLLLVASLVLGVTDAFYAPSAPQVVREQSTDGELTKNQAALEGSSNIASIVAGGDRWSGGSESRHGRYCWPECRFVPRYRSFLLFSIRSPIPSGKGIRASF